jgi:hypothetical protein
MKKKTKILLGVGALALIYFLYKRKKSVAQQTQEPQVGVSQGEPISDKASLFNLFTRTRYTNPTNTPKPRPQTLTQDQIWQLNQSSARIKQTKPINYDRNGRGEHQQQINVNKIQ